MKRVLCIVATVLFLSWTAIAQASAPDAPASKEDIDRYFQVMHSHEMMQKMAVSMSQGVQNMVHQQYLAHKNELPPDYEPKMNKIMGEMFQDMPWDEMMQAMAPVYQKHLTKGDVDNLIAFYSSPTGAKLLREMPEILSEAMQNATPIILKYMETVEARVQKETATMLAQSKKPAHTAPATHN